jgi:hypothetical protein
MFITAEGDMDVTVEHVRPGLRLSKPVFTYGGSNTVDLESDLNLPEGDFASQDHATQNRFRHYTGIVDAAQITATIDPALDMFNVPSGAVIEIRYGAPGAITTDAQRLSTWNNLTPAVDGVVNMRAPGQDTLIIFQATYNGYSRRLPVTITRYMPVDREALGEAISDAQDLRSITVVADQAGHVFEGIYFVTQAVMATFVGQIAGAQAVYDTLGVTQDQVDAAAATMVNQTAAFNTARTAGTRQPLTPEEVDNAFDDTDDFGIHELTGGDRFVVGEDLSTIDDGPPNVEDLIEQLTGGSTLIFDNQIVVFRDDARDEVVETGLLATGMVVRLYYSATGYLEQTVVVRYDLTGTGTTSSSDWNLLTQVTLEQAALSSAQNLAVFYEDDIANPGLGDILGAIIRTIQTWAGNL